MKILNIGSLNLDKVYAVDHIVLEGETILTSSYREHLGGKGLNQSIALKAAGGDIWHCGCIGKDGLMLKEFLNKYGVNTSLIEVCDIPSGHAIIQVSDKGANSIMVFGGANQKISESLIKKSLGNFNRGDFLLLQNEISEVSFAILQANEKGMKVIFNPSPITDDIFSYPLELIDIFILNETEGRALSGSIEKSNESVFEKLCLKYPKADIILTLGDKGVLFRSGEEIGEQKVYKTEVIDTTAAGDTFCGYFISLLVKNFAAKEAVSFGCAAASLAISKNGAAESIPSLEDVEKFLEKADVFK